MNNRKEGLTGEADAVVYLKKQGYRILELNYKTPFGEADIIAEQGTTIVFIEVKSRNSEEFGTPAEAVTPAKQRKYVAVANAYLTSKRLLTRDARFDVIEILRGKINHIADAFWA